MGSTLRLLLQLLLLSLVSASSYFGGTTTYTYKGRNPDGSFKVDIRDRDTYDGCYNSLSWYCSGGDCGHVSTIQTGTVDSSTGAPQYNGQWCEAERVTTRIVGSNKPFQMRADSCCWIPTINDSSLLRMDTLVDLGERSDTGEPNRSPEIAILPVIRVPQNCPRTYRLMSFDPNGDKVRCRYGNPGSKECSGCVQHSGFYLDQDSCTLSYQKTNADSRVRAFEMVVEDFPQGYISLTYTDGSQSYRSPLSARRRKRQAETTTTTEEPTTTIDETTTTTEEPTTTIDETTTTTWEPTTTIDETTTTTEEPTTTIEETTATTEEPTTTIEETTTTTEEPTTTIEEPTTTTEEPTTTIDETTTTTEEPTTTIDETTTTTEEPTTTIDETTTTTEEPTTTTEEPTTTIDETTTTIEETTTTPSFTTIEETTTTPSFTTIEETTTTPIFTTIEETTTTPIFTTIEETTTTPIFTTIEETTTTPIFTAIEETTTTPSFTTTEEPTTTIEETTTTTEEPTTTIEETTTTTEEPTTTIEETTTTPIFTTIEETTTTPIFTTIEETTTTPIFTTIEETTTTPIFTTMEETTNTPIFTTIEETTTTPTIPWWWTTSTPFPATSPPLSKLPLQFSFLVDPPAPSCQEGLYLPKFVHPTPANGERIHAEVNKEVEIRIRALASYAAVQDIITSGPMNMTKHRTTHDEFVLRWTPSSSNLGDYFPVCFAAESATGSDVYQSEMRCVILHVEKEEIITRVICTESAMRIEVEKSSLHGLHEDNLRLSEHSNTLCSLDRYSNSTHIIGIIPLNACGTQIEEDEENLIFKNEITTVDDHRDLITRKHHLEVQFYCQYPKKGNVTVGFTAHRENVEVWDKGFGKFTFQFEFYPNNQFQNMIDPNLYPLEYEVGQKIYMEIDASSTVNDTEIFVESCRATPYDNPNYHPTYSIIEDGCPEDPTVVVHATDNKRQFRFSIEAFKFIGLHDQVYISCSVIMCEAGNPNTRCSQGCINSASNDHHHRRKRDAAIQTAQHFISQGPLRLKRSADISSTAGNNLNLNLNLVFIAGSLLVVVGMICGVAMYRSKMSKVKYQPLPSWEN